MRGWEGLRAGLDVMRKRKTVLPLPGFELKPESLTSIFTTTSSRYLGATKHPWSKEE